MNNKFYSLICEFQCSGLEHVPVNAALILTLCLSYPHKKFLFIAENLHIEYVKYELSELKITNIEYLSVQIPKRNSSPFQRISSDFLLINRIIKFMKKNLISNLFMLSINTSLLFVLKLLVGVKYNTINVIAIPHSILDNLAKKKSRKPWYFVFNFKNVFCLFNISRIRYLLLGESIFIKMSSLVIGPDKYCSTLDHPYIFSNEDKLIELSEGKIVFGYIGFAHKNKGFDKFLSIADKIIDEHIIYDNENLHFNFVCVGRITDSSIKKESINNVRIHSDEDIPRANFNLLCKGITYAIFPYKKDAYDLYPSGAFFDALSHIKPIICIKNSYFEYYFKLLGDIGYLCEDYDEMMTVIKSITYNFPIERYNKQCNNILSNRYIFEPSNLTKKMTKIVDDVFRINKSIELN
jgi:hypothetical protein